MEVKSIKASATHLGVSRSTFYQLLKQPSFPQPIAISEGRKAMVVAELEAWIEARISERDKSSSHRKRKEAKHECR